jgi:uncharacterized protein YerC
VKRFLIADLNPALLKLDLWPAVAEEEIMNTEQRVKYGIRRQAIQMLGRGATRRQISAETSISSNTLIRLFKRACCCTQTGECMAFGH